MKVLVLKYLQSNAIITHYFRPNFSQKSVRYKENFSENLVTVKSKISTLTLQIDFWNYRQIISLVKQSITGTEICDLDTEVGKKDLRIIAFYKFL